MPLGIASLNVWSLLTTMPLGIASLDVLSLSTTCLLALHLSMYWVFQPLYFLPLHLLMC
ncbi:hypothetical protein RHMOL_Rhmol08G0165400 [Rhododendron molle]|nr:hypothetical protein RHMOL_Rhmol08G0165400 [Rhododendron molle]